MLTNVQNECKGDCCSFWFGYNQWWKQKLSFGFALKLLVLQTHLDGWLRNGNYQLCGRLQQESSTNKVSLCIIVDNFLCCCTNAILLPVILVRNDVIKIHNWNVWAFVMRGLISCMFMCMYVLFFLYNLWGLKYPLKCGYLLVITALMKYFCLIMCFKKNLAINCTTYKLFIDVLFTFSQLALL